MANAQVATAGLILLALGVLGYFVPISVTLADTTVNLTIPKVVAFCESGLGQFAQLSPQVVMVCNDYKNFMLGIYGSGILGIILIIVGAVKSGSKDEAKHDDDYEEELEDKYEKGEISLGEFTAKAKKEVPEEDAFEILKKRYAKGEISKEEFENIKKDLEN